MHDDETLPPWRTDHAPDAAAAARALDEVLRDEAPWRAEPLGEGWDFFAFRARSRAGGRELVVRVPRRAETVPWLEREIALLDRIAAAIGPDAAALLPRYEVRGARSSAIRHPFGAYPLLAGTTADRIAADERTVRRLGADLGRFLAALHRVPLDVLPAADGPPPLHDVPAVYEEAVDHVGDILGAARAASCRSFFAELVTAQIGPRVCAHADLGAEHVVVDPASGALRGVIDWADTAADARGGDLAGPWVRLGEAFLGAALDTYGAPDRDDLARVARRRGMLGMLEEARWFSFRGDGESVRRFVARIDEALARGD